MSVALRLYKVGTRNRPLLLRCRTPRPRLDGKAPRHLRMRGAFKIRSVGSRWWFVFLAVAHSAFGVRELHREHQRFVVEGLWSAACVLNQHHEIILVLSEPPHAASLIHNHKQQ